MTIRLRAHHLLCVLTYVGRGYTPAFTANYDAIAERLSQGEPITVIDGPDDICRGWIDDPDAHCRLPRLHARDGAAASDLTVLLRRPVQPGLTLVPDASLLSHLRAAFAANEIRLACAQCQWSDLCTNIAEAGYSGVRVAGGRGGSQEGANAPFPPQPPSPISRPQPKESS
ncbi:DUF1284 domain-containing protein [Aureimonas psammosilenae]|uniref:DUF1284 domain-containing protein n=1 Tax=Aureimonas psammosilenae TaxID=2495496 RepID=UPI00126058ED|nr:DUF1284 domain-containing protein [Aureimonas psammosilenae]